MRDKPVDPSRRWQLAQVLCVLGDWLRAMQQLQTLAMLDASKESLARMYRELIRAEGWRERVMQGALDPAFAYDDVPAWTRDLLDALHHDTQAADDCRSRALDAAYGALAIRVSAPCSRWSSRVRIGGSRSRISRV